MMYSMQENKENIIIQKQEASQTQPTNSITSLYISKKEDLKFTPYQIINFLQANKGVVQILSIWGD